MTYNQFNKLVIRLHQLAREEVPPFTIIKDLFDFLDIRKDGIIDMHEWMQSLSLIDVFFTKNIFVSPLILIEKLGSIST